MARYADGVQWIAGNDAPADTDGLAWNAGIERLRVTQTVTLLADLYGKEAEDVAAAVLRARGFKKPRRAAHAAG